MKLLSILIAACLLAITSTEARRVWPQPSLTPSCTVCDSSVVVDWGDGTYRSVIEVSGAGYDPGDVARLTWHNESEALWEFDITPYADGTFSTLWTDVPVGSYTVTASQPQGRRRFVEAATVDVVVF